MLTYNVPAGTNTDVFGRLLQEAGINTSMVVENGVAYFAELTEADASAVQAVWNIYQQRQTQRQQAIDAIQSNESYLGTSPTNAQVATQVKALTRQMNGLITILNQRGLLW